MRRLLRRSLLYFMAGAITMGTMSVVAPVHFDRHFPDQKAVLLTLCLVLGAAAAVLGIAASGRLVARTPRGRPLLPPGTALALFASLGILVAALYAVVDPLLFIPVFAAVQLVNQFIFNTVDQQYVRGTDVSTLETHSQVAAGYQLGGMVVAPVYFALAGTSIAVGWISAALIFLLLAGGVPRRELVARPAAGWDAAESDAAGWDAAAGTWRTGTRPGRPGRSRILWTWVRRRPGRPAAPAPL